MSIFPEVWNLRFLRFRRFSGASGHHFEALWRAAAQKQTLILSGANIDIDIRCARRVSSAGRFAFACRAENLLYLLRASSLQLAIHMKMLLVRTTLMGRSFGDLPHIRIFICAQGLQILLIGVWVMHQRPRCVEGRLWWKVPAETCDTAPLLWYLSYQLQHSGYEETRTECCNILQNIFGKPWIGQYILAKVS